MYERVPWQEVRTGCIVGHQRSRIAYEDIEERRGLSNMDGVWHLRIRRTDRSKLRVDMDKVACGGRSTSLLRYDANEVNDLLIVLVDAERRLLY